MKARDNGNSHERIKKGVVRGFMLIGIGYALRIPIFRWLSGHFGTYFMVIDVLQCIGFIKSPEDWIQSIGETASWWLLLNELPTFPHCAAWRLNA